MVDPKKCLIVDLWRYSSPFYAGLLGHEDAANGLRLVGRWNWAPYKLMSKLACVICGVITKKVSWCHEAGKPIEDPLWLPEMAMFSRRTGVLVRSAFRVFALHCDCLWMNIADHGWWLLVRKLKSWLLVLRQKARAAGNSPNIGDSAPSCNVITGLIKANIRHEWRFKLSSKIDSTLLFDQVVRISYW